MPPAKTPTIYGRLPAHSTGGVHRWKSSRYQIEVYNSQLDGGWTWIVTLFHRKVPLFEKKASLVYVNARSACIGVENFIDRVEVSVLDVMGLT